MMAQKLMSDNKDNPFNSRFFQPSDAYSKQQTRPIQGQLTLGNLASYFMPFSKDIGPYEDSPKLDRPGGVNIDFPPIVKDAVSGINKFGQVFRGELSQDEIKQLAFDTSLNVTGGSLVGSKLLKNAVPKDALSMGLTTKATKSLDNAGEVAKVVPPTDKSDGIIAFHGSPHDFNEFSLTKINTGEGAQAFGHGLYFSSKEGIAKFYRDSLRGVKDLTRGADWDYKGKEFKTLPDDAKTSEELGVSKIVEMAKRLNMSPDKAKERLVKLLEKDIKESKLRADNTDISGLLIKRSQKQLDAINSIDISKIKQSKGHMYEVKIDAVMDDLIDYDKNVGNQNKGIKEKISKLLDNELTKEDAINFGYDDIDLGKLKSSLLSENRSVESFLGDFSAIRGSKNAGEKLLNKYGIKGIQYLDNASRQQKYSIKLYTKRGLYKTEPIQSGSRESIEEMAKDYKSKGFRVEIEEGGGDKNFVIFDDKIIDVMAKYGIVGAIGVSAMQSEGGGDILPPGAI